MISQKELGLVYESVNKDLTFDDLMLPNEPNNIKTDGVSTSLSAPACTSSSTSIARGALLPTPTSLLQTPEVESPSFRKGLFSLADTPPSGCTEPHRSQSEDDLTQEEILEDEDMEEDCPSQGKPLRFVNTESQNEASPRPEEKAVMMDDVDESSDDADVVVCGECYKSFKSVLDLQQHKSQQRPCLKRSTCIKCEDVSIKGVLECKYCRQTRDTPWLLIKHAQLSHRIIICQEMEQKRIKLLAAKKARRSAGANSGKVTDQDFSPTPSTSQEGQLKASQPASSTNSSHSKSLLIKAQVDKAKLRYRSSSQQSVTSTKALLSEKWRGTTPSAATSWQSLQVSSGTRTDGTPQTLAIESYVCNHLEGQRPPSDTDQLSVESGEESEPTDASRLKVSAKLVSSVLGASTLSNSLSGRSCQVQSTAQDL